MVAFVIIKPYNQYGASRTQFYEVISVRDKRTALACWRNLFIWLTLWDMGQFPIYTRELKNNPGWKHLKTILV